MKKIEQAARPSDVEVNAKEVQAFIDRCEEEEIVIHSVMVVRHGKTAVEAYKAPFSDKYAHASYSVAKSFTSTAIGLAIEEGYLTLESRFLDIFPELRPEKYDPWLEKINVYHLLTMQAGKSIPVITERGKNTWLRDFAEAKWEFEPGTSFIYTSENMYVLCAMIKRTTGLSVTEFLTPRLYEPLDMDVPLWETDPSGIEVGGWGMFVKLQDIAKLSQLYLNRGKWGSRQILPEYWTVEGTRALADSSAEKTQLDSDKGYGFCFWRCGGYENAYRSDGMFSQFGFVFEDLDAVLAIQAGNVDEQQVRDAVWKHFPKAFLDKASEETDVEVKFPPFEKLEKSERMAREVNLDRKTITFFKPHLINAVGLPVSILPMAAVLMEKEKAGGINNVSFRFYDDSLTMTWTEGKEINTVKAGLDGEYRESRIVLGSLPYTALSVARWNDENTLEVRIRPIETVAERRLVFTFKDNDRVSMEPSTSPSSLNMLQNVMHHIRAMLKNDTASDLVEKLIPRVKIVTDPVHHGKVN